MANITEYLKQIMSARYGKDVRQSIHDSIQAINDESSEVGQFSDTLAEHTEQITNLASSHNTLSDYVHDDLDEEIGLLQEKIGNANTDIETLEKQASELKSTTTELDERISDLESSANAGAIINSASGHFITVNDSSDNVPTSLTLYGKATQGSTSGKNLLNNTRTAANTTNGITFTPVYENGMLLYYEISGTPTVTTNFYLALTPAMSFKAGSYIISGGYSSNIAVRVRSESLNVQSDSAGTDMAFTLTEDANDVLFYIRFNGAVGAVSGIKVYPMFRLASVSDSTYEPYTGGVASPNPDYPQEVTVAGADGDIVMTSCGKNLLSVSEYTTNPTGGKSQYMNVPYLEYGKRYFLSGKTTDGVAFTGANCQLVWWDENNKRIWASQLPMWSSGMVCDVDLSSAKSFSIYTNDGLAGKTIQIQLEEGAITPYERYTGTTATIPLTNGLAGIPVSSGGNYVDENGQQWMCDTLEFTASTGNGTIDSGVYIQRIKKLVITGNESFSVGSSGAVFFTVSDVAKSSVIGMCSHSAVSSTGDIRVTLPTSGDAYVRFFGYFSTAEEFANFAKQKYANGKPITIYYPLAELVETELTSEQLSAFSKIHIFHPTTNLFTDDIGNVGMKYPADTKLYVDNKFNELAAAILSAVGSEG